MKWLDKPPTSEQVLTHQLFFPVFAFHKKLIIGGRWLCLRSNGDPDIVILTIQGKGRILIWNGQSFTQPLDECRWKDKVKWLPIKSDGLPLDYEE